MTQTYLQHTLYREPIALAHLHWIVSKVEEQRKRLSRPLRILDLGCGTGMIAMPLASLGHYVEAVDVDPQSIAFAAQRSPFPNLKFLCLDATSEELARQVSLPFDMVIAADVLEHLESPETLIRNAIRCGSASTTYLFTVPNGYNLRETLEAALQKLRLLNTLTRMARILFGPPEVRRPLGSLNLRCPHTQHFTLRKLNRLFAAQGLRIEEIVKQGSIFTLGDLWFIRSHTLQRLDLSLGRRLPSWLAGDWYLALRHPTAGW